MKPRIDFNIMKTGAGKTIRTKPQQKAVVPAAGLRLAVPLSVAAAAISIGLVIRETSDLALSLLDYGYCV